MISAAYIFPGKFAYLLINVIISKVTEIPNGSQFNCNQGYKSKSITRICVYKMGEIAHHSQVWCIYCFFFSKQQP